MARKTFSQPKDTYDKNYFSYLISELESMTGLTLSKGERIEINAGDQTELVLVSPNGTKYKLTVNDAGTISTTTVV